MRGSNCSAQDTRCGLRQRQVALLSYFLPGLDVIRECDLESMSHFLINRGSDRLRSSDYSNLMIRCFYSLIVQEECMKYVMSRSAKSNLPNESELNDTLFETLLEVTVPEDEPADDSDEDELAGESYEPDAQPRAEAEPDAQPKAEAEPDAEPAIDAAGERVARENGEASPMPRSASPMPRAASPTPSATNFPESLDRDELAALKNLCISKEFLSLSNSVNHTITFLEANWDIVKNYNTTLNESIYKVAKGLKILSEIMTGQNMFLRFYDIIMNCCNGDSRVQVNGSLIDLMIVIAKDFIKVHTTMRSEFNRHQPSVGGFEDYDSEDYDFQEHEDDAPEGQYIELDDDSKLLKRLTFMKLNQTTTRRMFEVYRTLYLMKMRNKVAAEAQRAEPSTTDAAVPLFDPTYFTDYFRSSASTCKLSPIMFKTIITSNLNSTIAAVREYSLGRAVASVSDDDFDDC